MCEAPTPVPFSCIAYLSLRKVTPLAGEGEPVLVALEAFAGLMNEALGRSHMPRAYLLPSQSARSDWAEPTFKPAISTRSKVSPLPVHISYPVRSPARGQTPAILASYHDQCRVAGTLMRRHQQEEA